MTKPDVEHAAGAGAGAVPEKPQNPLKTVLIALLALACGFLTMNFHHILKTTHIHLSLSHHHKASAFCAFTGCQMEDPAVAAAAAAKAAADKLAAEQLANTTKAMTARVCGSPAIDGYAHVVPKCLEDSPTAQWWNAYYAGGGKQGDLVVHIEKQADYDGLAVFWGINNKKNSVEECAAHCLKHLPNTVDGPFKALPCNAFAYCPDEVCFEPDAHHHTKGDCWLKFTEGPAWPEVNMRGEFPPDFRQRHPTAPKASQWQSGVLLPPGVVLTNGTWGPRYKW
ncbi:hypothetical protein HYH03_002820 [Edaphochlamys debaryana]|uniref:Apple domain-containing protein n=1 Tax=Edaphochlamys debaryana TaxID=47281 RepID=A0A836C3L7_9CHLO|nr:hypothetical protein HYH03_002820 [Edaphochlamys debaryana]|eukprot:KAG2499241.1 hypothetical protein HYH03_002820 [Edaphochlamys debaryana]